MYYRLFIFVAVFFLSFSNVWARQTPFARGQLTTKQVEQFGEDGVKFLAEKNGWQAILTPADKGSRRQGFDYVYRSANNTIVVEAKGGKSPLGTGYGSRQGTPEWAVKAAEATLKSNAATEADKQAAKIVLKAAREGKLDVAVIRTEHVHGVPKTPVLEPMMKSTPTSIKLAKQVPVNLRGVSFNSMKSTTVAGGRAGRGVPLLSEQARMASKIRVAAEGFRIAGGVISIAFGVYDIGSGVVYWREIDRRLYAGELDFDIATGKKVIAGGRVVLGTFGIASGILLLIPEPVVTKAVAMGLVIVVVAGHVILEIADYAFDRIQAKRIKHRQEVLSHIDWHERQRFCRDHLLQSITPL